MKKISFYFITIFLVITLSLILILATVGIETKKFNNLIENKINESNSFLKLKLNNINFKIDIKELSLFLETPNPVLTYREIKIPANNLKVYIDFQSLITQRPQIKKIDLSLSSLDIRQLKNISNILKPSNLKSFINNNIYSGKLSSEIEIYLDEKNNLDNFIAKGEVEDLKTLIIDDLILKKTKFNFFADKTDILIKNIFGETDILKIIDGDLKVKLISELQIVSNFQTKINYNNKMKDNSILRKNIKNFENLEFFDVDLSNNFSVVFDNTFKVKSYNLRSNGKILKAKYDFNSPIQYNFLNEKIDYLSLVDTNIDTSLTSNLSSIKLLGSYSLDSKKYLNFDFKNIIKKDVLELALKCDFEKALNLDQINFTKPNGKKAEVLVSLNKNKNILKINEFSLKESNNSILVKNLIFNQKKFLSLEKISIKTKKNGKLNNDFSIFYKDKIIVKGLKFDATKLPKILSQETKTDLFARINKNIEIDFANIDAPLSEQISNFKLIGKIEKGKFVKISSKGSFGGGNFLDITMKQAKNNNKKYLEVYSDLTRPLLTEYSFFKGLSGGKLLFSSIIDENLSSSKLTIEDFKVINAPGMIKLLSLADLKGLADLAEGQGLSFDILEIKMEKNKNILKFNEILALGPSLSVLMEGYQDTKVTSIRGTLVPAKTLNKLISKIPILGDIVIPKEVGEGLFGISFKMKGPPGKIKTSINPIRTITPRFIQKIIDRKKKLNNFN
tara:strand:+ start:18629 stop:20821 length:2193 start_codon:yes stop_codon:yes gene_type:complete